MGGEIKRSRKDLKASMAAEDRGPNVVVLSFERSALSGAEMADR
jgi:hypothetical protein